MVDSPLKASVRRRMREIAPALRFDAEAAKDFARWRIRAREALREVLRFRGGPPEVSVRVEERVELDDCVREKVWLRTERDLEVPCYYFTPLGISGPVPALVCPHGHGGGKSDIAGVTPALYGHQSDYGLQFARNGYITLCPDHRGFGEMAYEESGADESWLSYLYHTSGETLQGRRLYDLFGCVTWLMERPEVDARRIGVAGLSLGGEMSMLLGALDDRVRAVVCSGIVRDLADEVVDTHHCACTFSPRLFESFDFPDIAASLAPKPLLIQNGRQDACCDPLHEGRGRDRIEAAYAAAGAAGDLHFDRHERGHDFLMPAPLAFLGRYLGGGA